MLILITQKLTEKPNLHLNLLNSQHSFPNKFKKELLTGSLVSGGLLTFFPNASWKKREYGNIQSHLLIPSDLCAKS